MADFLTLKEVVESQTYKENTPQERISLLDRYADQMNTWAVHGDFKDRGYTPAHLKQVLDAVEEWKGYEQYNTIRMAGEDLRNNDVDITNPEDQEILFDSRDPKVQKGIEAEILSIKYDQNPKTKGWQKSTRNMVASNLMGKWLGKQMQMKDWDDLSPEEARRISQEIDSRSGPWKLIEPSKARETKKVLREIITNDPVRQIRKTKALTENSQSFFQHLGAVEYVSDEQVSLWEKRLAEGDAQSPVPKDASQEERMRSLIIKAGSDDPLVSSNLPPRWIKDFRGLDALPEKSLYDEIRALRNGSHAFAKEKGMTKQMRNTFANFLENYLIERLMRDLPKGGIDKSKEPPPPDAPRSAPRPRDLFGGRRPHSRYRDQSDEIQD